MPANFTEYSEADVIMDWRVLMMLPFQEFLLKSAPAGCGILYAIIKKDDCKSYIGITKNFPRRLKAHCKGRPDRKHQSAIHRAIVKYGIENFQCVVLGLYSTISSLCEAEISAITKHGTQTPMGYNIDPGGRCGPQSLSTRKLMSENSKKRWDGMTHEERVSKVAKLIEWTRSPKGRKLLRENGRAQWTTEYRKMMTPKFKASNTAVVRKKKGDACRLRWQDPEYKKNVKDKEAKTKLTEQWRKKASERASKREADPEMKKNRSETMIELFKDPQYVEGRKAVHKATCKARNERLFEEAWPSAPEMNSVPPQDRQNGQIFRSNGKLRRWNNGRAVPYAVNLTG